MASDPSAAPKPIAEIEQGPSKFEQFLDANQRKLIVLAVILTLGLLGFVAYRTIERDNRHTAGADLTTAADLTALLDVTKNHAGTPAASSAQLLTADAQWNDGRQDDSIATLRDFLVNDPNHPARPTAIASLGSRLMAQGKNGEAKEKFQLLLDDPDARYLAPFALISLGDIARAEGDIDQAETLLSRARDEYPDQRFSSIATNHLALLRAADPTEIDPPPPPKETGVGVPPSSIARPEGDPDVSKPIILDPTKMPSPGGGSPLTPGPATPPTPDPGFNPTPPAIPPAIPDKPETAPGDAPAPEEPAKPADSTDAVTPTEPDTTEQPAAAPATPTEPTEPTEKPAGSPETPAKPASTEGTDKASDSSATDSDGGAE